jgi:hypothetical protein
MALYREGTATNSNELRRKGTERTCKGIDMNRLRRDAKGWRSTVANSGARNSKGMAMRRVDTRGYAKAKICVEGIDGQWKGVDGI